MKKSHFEKLVESVRQAGHVRRDELRPSREFRFAPTDIKAVRAKLRKSHSQFALMIGVSVSTLQNWEQGRRRPEGPAQALLGVAAEAPGVVARTLSRR